jgi:beta-lactam-binding protein with PASTA domain
MRKCQNCGRENADDVHFCECGEYLIWEPTQHIKAVAPPSPEPERAAPPVAPEPPVEEPQVRQAPQPAPQPPGNGHERVARTEVQPAASQPAAAGASLTLRLPDQEAVHGQTLGVAVEPGQRERVLALIRNADEIVDNYELRIDGLPEGWWSIYPDTVYLVPFGSAGTYEQEVEVHLHPPRTPEAQARLWELRVVAHSKAGNRDAVSAPLGLVIQPYTETGTKVRPERAKGRRKADYTVDVANQANAPVVVALEGSDPDGELQFGFDRPPAEIAPGQTVQTTMRVKPPKQMWIGRPVDKRFEVTTHTGEEATERLTAQPEAAEPGPSPTRRAGRLRIPGFSPPRVYKPQMYEPGVQIGPGGINIRKPQFRGPQMQGPQMQARNIQLSNLKGLRGGGGAAAAAPAGPLLPSQGVFRQKAWLPWWLIPVIALLAALIVLLLMNRPDKTTVPNVIGAQTAFKAQEKLTAAGLKVGKTEEEPSKNATPGTVIDQDPKAEQEVKKGSEVTLLIAVGTGKFKVPKIVGKNAIEAQKVLSRHHLTLGQASPQPLDPAKKIATQIPEAGTLAKEGAPVDIFFQQPGKGGGAAAGGAGGAGAGGAGAGGAGSGGAGTGADVTIPAIPDGATTKEYAQTLSDKKLVPETKPALSDKKVGTPFDTDPHAGATVKEGATVTVLVSAGFPAIVYDDNQDILRVNGATGQKLSPVSKGPGLEQDPAVAPDGERVAFVRDGRVFLANLAKPQSTPKPLTDGSEKFADLAWAPTTSADVLAMAKEDGDDTDLCFGTIDNGSLSPACKAEPGFAIGSAIHWAKNGKAIFSTGRKAPGEFGIVRWKTDSPFSPDPGDWTPGKFLTSTDTLNVGVRDEVVSPDGKLLAAVARLSADGPFELYLTKPDNFPLTNAKSTGVSACKVAWQPDSRGLVIVQINETCEGENADVGTLAHVPVDKPQETFDLKVNGDNPVFEPLVPGG